MHDLTTLCQPGSPHAGETSRYAPHPDDTVTAPSAPPALIRSHAAQTIQHTNSRRTGPRRWLRAVHWVLSAGHHPKTTNTTIRVAEDLAQRMDYDTGHARYCLDTTAARLGINRATVKRHVAYLRETGLLAWVSVGSRTNIRRTLGLPGYAPTATVYAAVIPPVVDEAMGRTRVGTGYTARVVVDLRGCQTSPKGASKDAPGGSHDAPDTTREGSCAPPSLTVVKKSGSVQVESGFKDTSRKRASRPTTTTRPHTNTKTASSRAGAGRRSPLQVAADIRIARRVRPLVTWTQTEGLRRLAYALRPLIDQGLDADAIAVELHSWMLGWRPAKPAAFIRCELARRAVIDAADDQARAEQAALDAQAVDPMDNPAWRALVFESRAAQELAAALNLEPARTDLDRRRARLYGRQNWQETVAHCQDDMDDALDLYGPAVCAYAIAQADREGWNVNVYA